MLNVNANVRLTYNYSIEVILNDLTRNHHEHYPYNGKYKCVHGAPGATLKYKSEYGAPKTARIHLLIYLRNKDN